MKFILFLRAINIAGQNIIKMVELRSSLEKIKEFQNVKTYIQTGNIILDCDTYDHSRVKLEISYILEKEFKVKSPQISVFDLEGYKKVLENNPYKDSGVKDCKIMVYFPIDKTIGHLKQQFSEDEKTDVEKDENDDNDDDDEDGNSNKSKHRDEWEVIDEVLFFKFARSYKDSKEYKNLTKLLVKIPHTTRNWRTCNKILNLC
ncbi:hypothetical protein DLAC_07378 [Tieghemostelium lacteum]|uniref:Uncharacterized protein n=1 Tax=Tieghemostelium lacteum TaxID=361077 RepID=A0A151ZCE5_TIELA|nr:hypothetical protein DLAC_07378 [Tieghemostelium lacteum]|eukprot:KYQ91609.1 hypothetical protein DLAC_07378 [Tieghemostelium lacteum]